MNHESHEEIPLTGGRVTKGVVKKGKFVYRPCCCNYKFVHNVLLWLESRDETISPHFKGINNDGREITTFLEGNSPDNLGEFSEEQLYEAGKLIKRLHIYLSDFPGCKKGQTVCHLDLSPCNFMFLNKKPYAIFDWDSAKIGDPKDDLAYAIWMWCDIGYSKQEQKLVNEKIKNIIKGYEIDSFNLKDRIISQMDRAFDQSWETEKQKREFQEWVINCKKWLIMNSEIFFNNVFG